MVIKTIPLPPYSSELAPYGFWLFPKLTENLKSSRFEDIQKIEEAVTRTQISLYDFPEAFTEWLDCYNVCIEFRGS